VAGHHRSAERIEAPLGTADRYLPINAWYAGTPSSASVASAARAMATRKSGRRVRGRPGSRPAERIALLPTGVYGR
jgi:hypothetical protein